MGDVKTFVDGKISGKKVVMFSKTYCPYCTKAKKALKVYVDDGTLKQDDYEIVEIDKRSDCSQIQDYLNKLTGGKSVPRVFIKGKFIGGGDDTEKQHREGKLKGLILAK